MCGILGHFSEEGGDPQVLTRFNGALHSLDHRGPDDHGVERIQMDSGMLLLGHTRLSIIDLTSGGHQPMQTVDGRFVLVFNGEIYNYKELRAELIQLGYRFVTESDTEVLLTAWSHWQLDCIEKLNGMFAFAVLDRQLGKLVLVRDAFGIKPLYYSKTATHFAFASELPALIKLNPGSVALNYQRAYDYLVLGIYDDQSETLFSGVSSLQPGHWIEFDLQTGSLREPVRWWWPSIAERTDLTFEQAAEQFRELFLDSIRLHLRSDVPLGAALSGGLDSSAIVCAMRYVEPDLPIHTFSFVGGKGNQNEEAWADLVNQHVQARAFKTSFTGENLLTDLDDLIIAQGEPFASTSIYAQYQVFKLARENGITVTLDGQGADECLAGYSGYPHARVQSFLDRRQYWKLIGFGRKWAEWPGRNFKQFAQIAAKQMCPDFLVAPLKQWRGRYSMPAWVNSKVVDDKKVDRVIPGLAATDDSHGRGLADALRNALTVRGLQALLRHGDRNSMRFSIESRVPFLSKPLVEFLLTLPESYLLSPAGETKRILRRSMRGIAPQSVLDRRDKIGFRTPELDWLTGLDSRSWLNRDILSRIPLLKEDEVVKTVESQLQGKQRYQPTTWRLLNFCRWFEVFNPSV